MNEAMNKVIKSHAKLAILTVFAVILVSIGTTYSLFQIDQKGKEQTIAVGDFKVSSNVTENLTLRDLHPESANKITDEDKKFEFTLSNDGNYDVNYEIVMEDVTETTLRNSTKYSSYKRLNTNYYKYINYKVDGGEVHNLESARTGSKFVVLRGALRGKDGDTVHSETHYIQFFIDNKDTTTEGAPNDINGSVLSLDISMIAVASNNPLDKIVASAVADTPDFSTIAPFIETVDNTMTQDMSSYQNNYITYADSYTYDETTKKFTLTGVYEKPEKYSIIWQNLKDKYVVLPAGKNTNEITNTTNLDTIYKISSATASNLTYTQSDTWSFVNEKEKNYVYSMEDEDGLSYYFRGNADNNYVKFGKNARGQDMWWRIIRINGSGTLRMIYDGTEGHKNGEASTDRVVAQNIKYNNLNDDIKYLGYMYGPRNAIEGTTTLSTSIVEAQTNTSSSTIKEALDNWYIENIKKTGYESYLADEVFCNDRSTPLSSYAGGYGGEVTYYGAYNRLVNNDTPSFKCNMNTRDSNNDKFTVNSEKGNGALSYPIGLITADEVEAAGGTFDVENTSYYLNKGVWYWTMTPSRGGSGYANMFVVQNNGKLMDAGVQNAGTIAPVINLTRESATLLKGSGTISDPYYLN